MGDASAGGWLLFRDVPETPPQMRGLGRCPLGVGKAAVLHEVRGAVQGPEPVARQGDKASGTPKPRRLIASRVINCAGVNKVLSKLGRDELTGGSDEEDSLQNPTGVVAKRRA